MTRKEKEEKLLDALGLKVGDKIIVNTPLSGMVPFKIFFSNEKDIYGLQSETDGAYCDIDELVTFDFEKVEEPKKWKDVKCGIVPCHKCPICHIRCWIDTNKTLQENLNRVDLDDEEREFYQKRIDREYKEK